MRYAALILTLLVIGLLGGISWQIVQFRAEPSIHVDGGDIFDVGIVPADRPVSHVFKLENPNPFPLSVSAPVAGCTCTTATVSSATILPGGEVSVTTHIYAVSDLSGNIRNWWSSSTRGNLDPYAYEAYGVEWITPAPEPPITYNVPFFYEGDVGYYQDPTTGLYYIKARWYDPVTGRFISEDPIGFDGGDWNQYVYVKNEPVNWTDSEGLRSHKKKHASKIVRLMVIPFISGHTESPAPYEHAYIDFSPGKCATEEAYGFWSKPGKGTRYPFPPHACFDCPGLVRVWPGTPLDPDIAKVKAGTWPVTQDSSNTNPAFIRRLCKNILASKKKPPNYSTDPLTFETCGSWAHQMWDSYK
jgi:RHS repeat-associated protein